MQLCVVSEVNLVVKQTVAILQVLELPNLSIMTRYQLCNYYLCNRINCMHPNKKGNIKKKYSVEYVFYQD